MDDPAEGGAIVQQLCTEEPTGRMRWLRKSYTTTTPDRLQQMIIIKEYSGGSLVDTRTEWRDVPLEFEK